MKRLYQVTPKYVYIHVLDWRFDMDEGSKHDLIVKEATYDVAGTYDCFVRDQNTSDAISTVAVFTLGRVQLYIDRHIGVRATLSSSGHSEQFRPR